MKYVPRKPREGINYSHVDPRREALVLVGGVGLVAVLVVVVIGFSIDLLVGWIPASWEAQLFDGFATRVVSGLSVKPTPRSEKLQNLMDRLAAHWPENPYSFRIGIMEEDTPNAMAVPGGAILVTTGLLEGIRSENELAFVLGHEIGHFKNRDHLNGLGRQLATTLMMAVVTGTAGGGADLLGFTGRITARNFGRNQELAADRAGLEIVYREYGHVASASDFFAQLPKDPEFAQRFQGYFATHPVTKNRISALERLAQEQSWPSEGRLQPFDAKQEAR
jgi:Zn-dependent protease with chaperone function